MEQYAWLLAGLFLPLFPLGMIFNGLFQRVGSTWMRALLLLFWPLAGLAVIQGTTLPDPTLISVWALFSAVLYGFRAVVVREVGIWIGFLATSSWVLVWLALAVGVAQDELLLHVLAFSLPLVLMVFLLAELERRYESAYAGIVSGVAQAQPRLAGIFVIALLVAIGSPLSPAFFALLNSITHSVAALPAVAVGIVVVWLLWSWSGMRLIQELLVGPAMPARLGDLTRFATLLYTLPLLGLVFAGLLMAGRML